jgi:hypothetical protein
MRGGGRLPERTLFAHLWRGRGRDGQERALRAAIQGRYKWIGGGPEGTHLYDLLQDPREWVNRKRELPEQAEALRLRYQEFERGCRKLAPEYSELSLDEREVEELKALGYVN